jgi:hypothetical protein
MGDSSLFRRLVAATLKVTTVFLDECIGLFSSFENAWVDCFREADFRGLEY